MLWKRVDHTQRYIWGWGCNQRSLTGGRDTWAVVWRRRRTKPGRVRGLEKAQMRSWCRKESNTVEGHGEGQHVWSTGAEAEYGDDTGEALQGPYRSCGRIFISTLRKWRKSFKYFRQGSEGIRYAFWILIPWRRSWTGRNMHEERPFRR